MCLDVLGEASLVCVETRLQVLAAGWAGYTELPMPPAGPDARRARSPRVSRVTIYSLDVLLFLFGTSLLFHVRF